jgi:hypothetical protein
MALMRTLAKVDEFLEYAYESDIHEIVPELWASILPQIVEAVRTVKQLAWADESISIRDAEAIDRDIAFRARQYGIRLR